MISIIMPITQQVKNEDIKLSIQSILEQTFTDYHIIIGINSSITTDTSYIKDYSAKIDIIYIDTDSKYDMIAKLLVYAPKEWITFIEPGDIWYNNKLQTQWDFTGRYEIIGSGCHYVGRKNGMPNIPNCKIQEDSFLYGCPMVNNTLLIKKHLCKWNAYKYDIHADFNMLYKLFSKGTIGYNVPQVLSYCKISIYNDIGTMSIDIHEKLIKKVRRKYNNRIYN